MSTKVNASAPAVQTQTPNYTPGPNERPQMSVERPAANRSAPDAQRQQAARASIGRPPDNTAPTETQRNQRPAGTILAGALARGGPAASAQATVAAPVAKGTSTGNAVTGAAELLQRGAYQNARTIAAHHSQTAVQIRRMGGQLNRLENAVRNGAPARIQAQLQTARTEYNAAKTAWQAERPLARAANDFLRNNQNMRSSGQASQLAGRFNRALQNSPLGRRVLAGARRLTSPQVTRSLTALSGAVDAYNGYANSTNRTTAGRVLNGGLNAGFTGVLTGHPVAAIADAALPKGYRPSDLSNAGADAVSGIIEGVATGNEAGAAGFQERSERGHYGTPLRLLSQGSAHWTDRGIGGTVRDFGKASRDLYRMIF
jgi:hypothetical protein